MLNHNVAKNIKNMVKHKLWASRKNKFWEEGKVGHSGKKEKQNAGNQVCK